MHELRPSVTHPKLWYPERLPKSQWDKIRKAVVARDNNTCQFCGHAATKYMNAHHVDETGENEPENLITCCVACHAVLHLGRSLALRVVEVWKSEISQAEIVQVTRQGIKDGKSLEEIKSTLPISKGKLAPTSEKYANELILTMGDNPRASLKEPLCAVFVNLTRWQIE